MTARYKVKDLANTATQTAQTALHNTYAALGQTSSTPTPVLEGDLNNFNHDYEEDSVRTYWYHPDHPSTCLRTSLGSSSYITNVEGIVTQHLEYMPYGEPSLASSPTPKKSINTSGQSLVEEHQNSINTPYKFNGKEQDPETGNYYYGARYYNPKFSFWLSVDPLAEKMPEWSSYAYTFNNPVKFADPTGMVPEIIDPPTKAGTKENEIYIDKDAGVSYVWDGKDSWHSDLSNKQELDAVVIHVDKHYQPDCVENTPPENVFTMKSPNATNTILTPQNNNSIILPILGVTSAVSSELLDGSSVRLFRQNGTIFSPKLYQSGWNGGSVSRIRTFNTTGLASTTKLGGVALGVYGLYSTYDSYATGKRSGLGASVDAIFGGVGFAGWPGSVISSSYELGKSYGPSTWFGTNDFKWFE